MKSVAKILCLVVACGVAAGVRFKAMTLHNTITMNVLSEFPIFSLNFPNPAPSNVIQIWKLTTRANAVIRLDCSNIELAETLDCGSASVTFTGTREGLTMCGANNNIFYRSEGPSMTVVFRSGTLGGGRLNCKAVSRLIGPQGEVTDLPSLYNAVPSMEIDSSEDGGPQGRKVPTCPCGWANKGNERIVGGKETKVNEFPFIAGVALRGAVASFCGSSLLTVSHAVTAAHCTDPIIKGGQLLSLIVGDHNQLIENETNSTLHYNVAQIIQHQGYRPFSFINDIALLVTEMPILLTPNIGLVCAPTKRVDLTNQMVKIIGWGALTFQGVGSPVLRKVDVRVIPHLACSYQWENVSFALQTQICTYGNQKASCQGDSGGPVVWVDPETNRYTLVGLVSYGAICGDHMPSVHTDAFAYMPWIVANIQATRPTSVMCGNV